MMVPIDPARVDSGVGFDVPVEFSPIALHSVTPGVGRHLLDASEAFSPAVGGRPLETKTRELDENDLEGL